MPDSNASSAEQLDALLEEGKISREEYETLRKAMDATVADEAERRRRKAPQRLRKSRKNRQLGGVCAGIAERIGISPWRVRWVALIAFLLTRGIALVVYLCLYLLLPWDETEELKASEKEPVPRKFLVRLGGLWLANLLLCVFLGGYFSEIFEGLGQPLPDLTRWAIQLGASLGDWPIGYLHQFLLLGSVVGLYLILPANKPGRRIFATAVYAVLLLHLCLVAAAFYLAVFTMGDAAGSL
jgi:phage shock protein PspC (stress-responsive transcriptional regulator)